MSDHLPAQARARVRGSLNDLQCPAPADFLEQPSHQAMRPDTGRDPAPVADRAPGEHAIRQLLQARYGRGAALRFDPHPPRLRQAATEPEAGTGSAVNPIGRAATSAQASAPAPPAAATATAAPHVMTTGGRLPAQRMASSKPPFAVRALNNMSFGATSAEIAAFNALGASDSARLTAWVDAQLNWSAIDDGAVEARLTGAGYATLGKSLPQLWADHVASNPDYAVRMRPAWEIQRAALVRAAHSKRQLREVMTMFWHDHFNVMCTDYAAGPVYVHYDRDVIRKHAFGNFRAMLEDVAKSTAMMYFLDNQSNTRAGPNENFARELLELHSFGAENYLGFMDPFQVPPCPEDPAFPIGYTDIDVYETAAAFTGWTIKNGNYEFPNDNDGTFVYRESKHDAGPKYPLGMFLYPEQAALKDGHDILDRIANHPRVAKFVCRKLIRRFFSDAPAQALIDSAAAVFRANWQKPDQIKLTLRHILLSQAAYDVWGQKMRRPFEAVAAAMRTLGSDWTLKVGDGKSDEFMWRLGFTGHTPYDWPAPNGYPDTAAAWSGSNSFAMSWKLLNWFTETTDAGAPLAPILAATRAGVASWTSTALVDYWCKRVLGYLPEGRQVLIDFMRQNGAASDVVADTESWSVNDLKKHYNQSRLRSLVSLILLSPEFLAR